MNTKILSVILLGAMLICSCGNDYEIEEYFDLQQLPGYVAFKTDGRDAVLPPYEVAEDGGSVSVGVENPTSSFSDITVNYSFSGTAEFGVDYTVDGATSAGGSLVITQDDKDLAQTNFTNIDVMVLTDSIADGDKSLMITLIDASNADGNVAVGRGGTDFLKTAEVVIADVDGEEGE